MDDLNHIQLSPGAIATLYRSALIDTGEKMASMPTPPPVVSEETRQWKFLGQNQKNILIVLDYDDAVYLPDDELAFLTNMLTACKLSIADVAIINRHHYPAAGYKEWGQQLTARTVLLFGVGPSTFGLPMDFPEFQLQSFTGITFLYSPALAECRTDSLVKSKLWVCLRRVFGI